MEVIFGHLGVLHSKFHVPTISNLGDQSGQTDKHTNTQTHKETNRQSNIYSRCMDIRKVFTPTMYSPNQCIDTFVNIVRNPCSQKQKLSMYQIILHLFNIHTQNNSRNIRNISIIHKLN